MFKVHDFDSNKYISASNFVVAMGSLDRYIQDNNTLYIYVKSLLGHKNYNRDTFEHDIALLFLAAEVPSNHPTIQPIFLASRSPEVGGNCIISGWGTIYYKGPESSRLMAAEVSINSRNDCNRPSSHQGRVLNGMFCAGLFSGLNISDSW